MSAPAVSTDRLGYLDSIRGLAALAVVLCHCWLLTPTSVVDAHVGLSNALTSASNILIYGIGRLKEAGHSAVILFFVLSGFVLAHSLQRHPTLYLSYIVKRVFRLYPAFAFAVLVSYALHRAIGAQHESGSRWFNSQILHPDMSFGAFLKHLAIWGTAQCHGLNIAIWSLVHEMRISAVFPIVLYTVVRLGGWGVLIWAVVSVLCTELVLFGTGTAIQGTDPETFGRTFVDTAYFIVFFAAGALLAVRRDVVAYHVGSLPQWAKLIPIPVLAYLLLKTNFSEHSIAGTANDYVRGLGAVMLIALAIGRVTFQNVLSRRSLQWLGCVSYSLYLIHVPILYFVSQTIGNAWSSLEVSMVVIPASLVAADLMARIVEFPSIELGKKLVARLPVGRAMSIASGRLTEDPVARSAGAHGGVES